MDDDTWMQIGQATREHRLQEVASQLEHRWPGRYQFRIARGPRLGPPTVAERRAERRQAGEPPFVLFLRHR